MATEGGFRVDESLTASTGLTAAQYFFVRSTGGNTCLLATSATGGVNRAVGVLQNDPASGQAAQVRFIGRSKITTGGAITAGDLIASSTGGAAVTASTTGQFVVGKALNAGSSAGTIIDMYVLPTGVWMGSTA